MFLLILFFIFFFQSLIYRVRQRIFLFFYLLEIHRLVFGLKTLFFIATHKKIIVLIFLWNKALELLLDCSIQNL